MLMHAYISWANKYTWVSYFLLEKLAIGRVFFNLHENDTLYTETTARTLLILGSNFNSTVRVEITPFWGVKKIEYISLQNQG